MKGRKRILSSLLCLLVLVMVLPLSAFAAEAGEGVYQVVIDDATIEAIMRFGKADIDEKYLSTIRTAAEKYVDGIMQRLREHEYNPALMRLYIVGGGGCLVKNFGKYDPDRVTINDDICAMAKGYEALVQAKLRKEGRNA